MKKLILVIVVILLLGSCTQDIPMLREKGQRYLESFGFKVLGYEGFQWGIWGGKCWFMIEDPSAANARSSVYLIERRGEIHLYSSDAEWADNKRIQIDK